MEGSKLREVAFGAATVYAQAAESRGAWDARLESVVVDAVLRDDAQGVQQGRFVQTIRREQQVTGGLQAGKGGFDGDHGRILARQGTHRLSKALT